MAKFPEDVQVMKKLGHLRENAGKMGRNCLDFTEGGPVSDNLATFGQNVDNFDDDATSFSFGSNNPDDPDGERQPDVNMSTKPPEKPSDSSGSVDDHGRHGLFDDYTTAGPYLDGF